MPKGEHFKKDNPRIHQVSFKVNKTELEELQKIVKDANLSVPEWIRGQITNPKDVTIVKATKPRKSKPKPSPDSGVHKGEQTSMF